MGQPLPPGPTPARQMTQARRVSAPAAASCDGCSDGMRFMICSRREVHQQKINSQWAAGCATMEAAKHTSEVGSAGASGITQPDTTRNRPIVRFY